MNARSLFDRRKEVIMVADVVDAYRMLQHRALGAVRSSSMMDLLALRRRSTIPTRYLYLHPALWTIAGPSYHGRALLRVSLPPSEDPAPVETLTRAVSLALDTWLNAVGDRLSAQDRANLRRAVSLLPTFEQLATGSETLLDQGKKRDRSGTSYARRPGSRADC